MRLRFLSLLAIALMYCLAGISANVINNDTFWKTTSGSYIFSQGGGIFRFPDAQGVEHYYWYGVKYQEAVDYCPNALGGSNSNITNFLAVTCYQSDDLVNWKFVRNVLTPESAGWAYWVGRLGVAYVEEANKYALLVQFNDHVLVATCSTPTGNFARHNEIDMTNIIGTPNTGDQTVFTDPDTGKSYLCYSYGSGRGRIYLSEIGVCSDGKIGLKDCHQIYKGSGREGDCMFKYQNKYYVCASDLYGWNASNVYYLEATDIYGPYTPTNSMQVMPGSADDYGHVTQTGFFYTVRGTKQETVIYCGDRWAGFAGNGNGFNQWCPLSFVNNKPYFNSLSQWYLDAETGEWWVGPDNNYVKNFSFDADRVNIPSGNKPKQDYLRGWNTTVLKGNSVVIDGADSPVLNAKNNSTDRATVMGNRCLNMQDKVDFTRQVSQTVKSSTYVPLTDGLYTLACYVKTSAAFNELYMYAKVGMKLYRIDLPSGNSQWQKVELKDVKIKDGRAEVGFYADGTANTWCHIDDVSLVRTGDLPADDPEDQEEVVGEPITISWSLGQGEDDETAGEVSLPDYIGEAVFDHGKMTVSKTSTVGSSQQTLYHPSNDNAKSANNDDVLTFTIKPNEGVTFYPEAFSFDACRWGTDGGKYDVLVSANGYVTTLDSGVTPDRNNSGYTAASYDLEGMEVGAAGMQLKIRVYALAAAKEYGFANVTVTGRVVRPSDDDINGISVFRPSFQLPEYYTLDGMKANDKMRGLMIVRDSNGRTKKITR